MDEDRVESEWKSSWHLSDLSVDEVAFRSIWLHLFDDKSKFNSTLNPLHSTFDQICPKAFTSSTACSTIHITKCQFDCPIKQVVAPSASSLSNSRTSYNTLTPILQHITSSAHIAEKYIHKTYNGNQVCRMMNTEQRKSTDIPSTNKTTPITYSNESDEEKLNNFIENNRGETISKPFPNMFDESAALSLSLSPLNLLFPYSPALRSLALKHTIWLGRGEWKGRHEEKQKN